MKEYEISKVLAEFEFDREVEISGNHIYKANSTEADFMDGTRDIASRYYCDDLNTLIPIWGKLKNIGFTLRFDTGDYAQPCSYFLIDSVSDEYGRSIPDEFKNKKLQYKMALATALAIIELSKDS